MTGGYSYSVALEPQEGGGFTVTVPAHAMIVPVHGSKDFKPSNLPSIIGQAGLSIEEFLELL